MPARYRRLSHMCVGISTSVSAVCAGSACTPFNAFHQLSSPDSPRLTTVATPRTAHAIPPCRDVAVAGAHQQRQWEKHHNLRLEEGRQGKCDSGPDRLLVG